MAPEPCGISFAGSTDTEPNDDKINSMPKHIVLANRIKRSKDFSKILYLLALLYHTVFPLCNRNLK